MPLLVIGVLLLTMLAGCGGAGDSAPLSKAEFRKQGNKICKQWAVARSRLLGEASKKYGDHPSQATQEAVIAAMVETYERMPRKLKSLQAPESDQAKVDEAIAAMERAAWHGRARPVTALAGKSPFTHANELALSLQLHDCVG